ncbi:serine hydrolase domain-containing protein, partial [Bacillus sp. B-TM1]
GCCSFVFPFLNPKKNNRTANRQQPMTKKRTIVTIIFLIATIAQCIMFFAFDWSKILIWQTYSVLTALISSTLLTASITWFVYTHRLDASVRK